MARGRERKLKSPSNRKKKHYEQARKKRERLASQQARQARTQTDKAWKPPSEPAEED